MKSRLCQMEWSVLANEQAIASCLVLIIGSTVGLIELFQKWQIALYSLIIAVLILLMEYPRGVQKGQIAERRFQKHIIPIVAATGMLGRSYYIRFVLYLCLGIPSCFLLPTLMGGLCLIISSVTYLIASVCEEKWQSFQLEYRTEISEQTSLSSHHTLELNHRNSSLDLMKETVC